MNRLQAVHFDGRALLLLLGLLAAVAYGAYWAWYTAPDEETDPDFIYPHNQDYVGRFETQPPLASVEVGKDLGRVHWNPVEERHGNAD